MWAVGFLFPVAVFLETSSYHRCVFGLLRALLLKEQPSTCERQELADKYPFLTLWVTQFGNVSDTISLWDWTPVAHSYNLITALWISLFFISSNYNGFLLHFCSLTCISWDHLNMLFAPKSLSQGLRLGEQNEDREPTRSSLPPGLPI